MSDGSLDFSFSGFKTAVLRHVEAEGIGPLDFMNAEGHVVQAGDVPTPILDLMASFQASVVDYLVSQTIKAAHQSRAAAIGLAGGVACNSLLRVRMTEAGVGTGVPVFYTKPALTTDNAAMIAEAGYRHLLRGETADFTLNAVPSAAI